MFYDKTIFFKSSREPTEIMGQIHPWLADWPELDVSVFDPKTGRLSVGFKGEDTDFLHVGVMMGDEAKREIDWMLDDQPSPGKARELALEANAYASLEFSTGIRTDRDVEMRSLIELTVHTAVHGTVIYDSDTDEMVVWDSTP